MPNTHSSLTKEAEKKILLALGTLRRSSHVRNHERGRSGGLWHIEYVQERWDLRCIVVVFNPSTGQAITYCCACRLQKMAEREQACERGPHHCWSGTCIYSACRRQWWPTMVGTGDTLCAMVHCFVAPRHKEGSRTARDMQVLDALFFGLVISL